MPLPARRRLILRRGFTGEGTLTGAATPSVRFRSLGNRLGSRGAAASPARLEPKRVTRLARDLGRSVMLRSERFWTRPNMRLPAQSRSDLRMERLALRFRLMPKA